MLTHLVYTVVSLLVQVEHVEWRNLEKNSIRTNFAKPAD